jgi:hypothetical protein
MALWGKTDTLASAPKYVTRKAVFDAQSKVSSANDTIDLSDANTNFATGDGVVYTGASGIGLTQGTAYYAMRQTDNTIKLATTEAGAKAGATGINLTAGATGAIGYLQRNTEGNEDYDHNYNGRDLYFIDADEAQQAENIARGLKVPGWTNYRSYTDANGNVRHKSEVLVAMSSYTGATGVGTYQEQTGDATDDTVLVDATVTITAQPAATATAVAGAAIATLASVTATITGAGTLTYQWQHSTNGGASYSNINPAGGVFTGADTATLGVNSGMTDTSSTWNNAKFRCVVGASTGNTDKTSTALTLTVTP